MTNLENGNNTPEKIKNIFFKEGENSQKCG